MIVYGCAVYLQKEKYLLKTYIAILLFLVLSLRPIYYLGQVVYFELNIDYIIQTYCVNKDKPQLHCNGKCHLAKQLQFESEESPAKGHLNTTAILECFYAVFNNPQTYSFSMDGAEFAPKRNPINHYHTSYSFLQGKTLLRPPIT